MVCPILVEWRSIPGYEGTYAVSNVGQIKRLVGKGCRSERILKIPPTSAGYPHVVLSKNGIKKTWQVHHAVALAFHGERPANSDTRHLDDNKLHNCAHNISYGTRSENVFDSIRNGTYNGGMRKRGVSDFS